MYDTYTSCQADGKAGNQEMMLVIGRTACKILRKFGEAELSLGHF
jgi:hypothetical protein